jgi:hypothetical protein
MRSLAGCGFCWWYKRRASTQWRQIPFLGGHTHTTAVTYGTILSIIQLPIFNNYYCWLYHYTVSLGRTIIAQTVAQVNLWREFEYLSLSRVDSRVTPSTEIVHLKVVRFISYKRLHAGIDDIGAKMSATTA